MMRKRGFTMVELIAALSILAAGLAVVAQIGYWSLLERQRAASYQTALEVAENILQQARATPWEDLHPGWASALVLSDQHESTFPNGKLTVDVAPDKSFPLVKRITVAITWKWNEIDQIVQLVGMVSPRTAKGGVP